MKKWLLLVGLAALVCVGSQPSYASEESTGNASIIFYDSSPIPHPIDSDTILQTNSQVNKESSKKQRLPQTNEEDISWLHLIIGNELILLVWLLLWKRRKEEAEDEQNDSKRD